MITTFPPPNVPAEALAWANQLTQTVQQLAQQVSNLTGNSTTVSAAQASTMQVLGSKIANVAANVAAAIAMVTIDASQVVSGTLSRPVSTTSTVLASDLYTTNGPSFSITGPRVTSWLENSTGRVATASSSRRYKTAIRDAKLNPNAILAIGVKYYQYIAEIAKRDDPEYPDYVGPEYHVATNIGMIAEDLHAAGLWEFVVYSRDPDGKLVLDDSGEPIPDGIHYEIFSVALLVVAQSLDKRLTSLEGRIETLEGKSK